MAVHEGMARGDLTEDLRSKEDPLGGTCPISYKTGAVTFAAQGSLVVPRDWQLRSSTTCTIVSALTCHRLACYGQRRCRCRRVSLI